MSSYETLNACAVTRRGDQVVVLMPRARFTREEALMFAAWLVATATLEDSEEVSAAEATPGDIGLRVYAVRAT